MSLTRVVDGLAAALSYLGAACLAAMMIVTCLDVIGRAVERPFWGLVETVSILATLMLALSLPTTQRERGHVALDMAMRKLGARASAGVDAGCHLLSLAFFALVAWQCWLYAGQMAESGELTMSLGLPVHLILRLIALAFAVLALSLTADTAEALRRAVRP
ncbi:MAG: TRAP transporter small permease [Thermodesulfobacteriota bacterium]